MAALHHTFAFTGYWLTVPPGAEFNQWQGKRALLRDQGWGFLVLANGKLEKEILAAKISPGALGQQRRCHSRSSQQRQRVSRHTQSSFSTRKKAAALRAPQAAYLLAWVAAVASSDFAPGVYASGQRTEDDPGVFITTIDDIRQRIAASMAGNNPIFTASTARLFQPPEPTKPSSATSPSSTLQDTCAPGPRLARLSGQTPSQSRRRAQPHRLAILSDPPPPLAHAELRRHLRPRQPLLRPRIPHPFLDNDAASTPDPSHGR